MLLTLYFKKRYFLSVLVSISVSSFPALSSACQCRCDNSLEDSFYLSKIAFIGEIDGYKDSSGNIVKDPSIIKVGIAAVDKYWPYDAYRSRNAPVVIFRVAERLKGIEATIDTITLDKGCGMEFYPNERYLVFTDGTETGYCSGTRPFRGQEEKIEKFLRNLPSDIQQWKRKASCGAMLMREREKSEKKSNESNKK